MGSRLLLLVLTMVIQAAYASEEDVHHLIDRFHASAADADFEAYFDAFAEGAYFLGTDAAERWSVPEFKVYAQPSFAAGRGWTYNVVSRNIETGPTPGIYWFDEVLSNAMLGRCRGTGVVLETPKGLKIAHYSLSMLIPNEIADVVGRQTMDVDAKPSSPIPMPSIE